MYLKLRFFRPLVALKRLADSEITWHAVYSVNVGVEVSLNRVAAILLALALTALTATPDLVELLNGGSDNFRVIGENAIRQKSRKNRFYS